MRIILIGIVLSILLSKIYTINPLVEIIGDGGDNYEYFAFQNLVRENIQHGRLPFGWTDTLRYPVGFDLGTGYDGAMVVVTGGMLGLFLPLPLVYNLTVVITLFLNFFFSYLLFKKLSDSELTGLLGAIWFGYTPYVFARINSHLNLAFIGGFPLFLYSLLCFYEKIKNKLAFSIQNYLLFFGSLLLTFSGSLQYLIFLFYLVVAILAFLVVKLHVLSKVRYDFMEAVMKSRNYLLISAGLFILSILFLYSGYLSHLREIISIPSDKFLEYVKCCTPSVWDVFLPNIYLGQLWSLWNSSTASIEKVVTIGTVEWGILIGFFLFATKRKLQLVFLILTIVFLSICLNFLNLPFIPERGRIVILFSLISFSVMAVEKVFEKKAMLIFLIILLLVERLSFGSHKGILPSREESEIVKTQPGKGVMNIPVSKYNSYRSILPYFYQKKIIDGYFHYTAENQNTIMFLENDLIQRYICDSEKEVKDTKPEYKEDDFEQSIKLLKKYDIRTIIVHKTKKDKLYFDDCENVRYWWYQLNPAKLILSSETTGVEAKTLELTAYPYLKAQIFFKKSGKFNLNGFSLFPVFLTDTKIIEPDEKITIPEWKNMGTDLRSTFLSPISLHVEAGNTLTIISKIKIREPIYLTIFYGYQPDSSSLVVEPQIEKIYQNQDIEIYNIN